MKEYEINAITKPNRESAHEHITHIGNNYNNWRMTREIAIARIDAKSESYYVTDPYSGKRAYVGVVKGDGYKAPYLCTYSDGKWNNNLLSLPECSGTELIS